MNITCKVDVAADRSRYQNCRLDVRYQITRIKRFKLVDFFVVEQNQPAVFRLKSRKWNMSIDDRPPVIMNITCKVYVAANRSRYQKALMCDIILQEEIAKKFWLLRRKNMVDFLARKKKLAIPFFERRKKIDFFVGKIPDKSKFGLFTAKMRKKAKTNQVGWFCCRKTKPTSCISP